MNLTAYISKSGFCSRRKAALYIKEGKVKVGGKVVGEPWYEIKAGDAVKVGGKLIRAEKESYLVLNKPKGVTSTLEDRFAKKKIVDLVPKRYGRLYPVGRLDKDSRGLIILTNDGELCYRLTHPKFEVEKEYRAVVEGEPDSSDLEALRHGVQDRGEELKVKSYSLLESKNGRMVLSIIIKEGKKRHIRRLFSRLGMNVVDLERVRIGGLTIGNLHEGTFKELDKKDIYRLALKGSKEGSR